MSRPKSRMCPPVTRCSPLIRLKRVVLPAPLGPMMARRSPRPTDRLTSLTAVSPPNDLVTPARLRTAAVRSHDTSARRGFTASRALEPDARPSRPVPQGTDDSLGRIPDGAHVHEAQNQEPALGVDRHEVLQQHD